ncbi:MAG: hypothetical protein PUB19_08300 [Lachnospiraceae bacterium]|nr:hypothetical protein [Lachnospiraceae bacterium]
MSMNPVTGTMATASYSPYGKGTDKNKTKESAKTQAEQDAVYEKSEGTEKKATYSINKMSREDRAALVQQLKQEQQDRESSLITLVQDMMRGQAKSYSQATGDTSIWRFLASGDFTVDAATKAQAQQDISEDGYWGVKQTSQRLFDFASALAGDDVDKMKEMQAAMEKGFRQATAAWGKSLPSISQDTMTAANKLFEEYYASRGAES